MKYISIAFAVTAFFFACSKKTTTDIIEENTAANDPSKMSVKTGEKIYNSECNRCHEAMSIAAYTKSEWDKILPNMIRKAKLSENDAANLSYYVYKTLEK